MLILDFYVDEPACFGVPPYLSPYSRYTAGALVAGGIAQEKVDYLTVDAWREQNYELKTDPELVCLVAGTTVPGKYLGGKIGTVQEVLRFLEWRKKNQGGVTLIGGPIRYADPELRKEIEIRGGILIRGDLEVYAERVASHPSGIIAGAKEIFTNTNIKNFSERHTYEQVDRYSTRGAFLSNLHPNFPHLILELETYRGCTRDVFCSFCTEAFYGKPVFRKTQGILDEVAELYKQGNRYFRLGRQADLMTYLPDMNDFKNSFPRPKPESLETLYGGIRRLAPDLKMLHLDNINPGLISTFPEEARKITEIICKYNTAGDTAAMGLETADPEVVRRNDLKVFPEEAIRAISIVNEFGAKRDKGIPKLLPGLNLIHGLAGETEDTFKLNYEFLRTIMEKGLLLRRINIRQAVVFHNTKLEKLQDSGEDSAGISRKKRRKNVLEERFVYYRDKIRHEIDHPMLLLNFPVGTIIEEVILEFKNQGFFLGRTLGSYPVTMKIPLSDKNAQAAWNDKRPLNAIVVGAEERSLMGLSHPIDINHLSSAALEKLPGLGKKSASNLFVKLPAKSYADLQKSSGGTIGLPEKDFLFL